MKHTLQSLLPLLDTPEGLEKLRIITAEADGWTIWHIDNPNETFGVKPGEDNIPARIKGAKPGSGGQEYPFLGIDRLPNYTLSLDAIFAAEEQLGLHDSARGKISAELHSAWIKHAELMLSHKKGYTYTYDLPFLTTAQRCIPFILTKQEITK